MESQAGGARPPRVKHRRGEGGLLRQELIAAARFRLEDAESEGELTIRGVARAAGIAPQSFYLQFEGLDELLYEVYAEEYSELRRAMEGAAASQTEEAAQLLAACAAYCEYAEAHPGRYRAMTKVRGRAEHRGWEARALPGARTFELIRDLTARALAARGSSADPWLAAVTLWAALHGTVSLRATRPAFPWPPLDQMVEAMVGQTIGAAKGGQSDGPIGE